ncbi:hypothetical protein DM860_008747 [Cuscuta australis]|uniref:Uncharacterized protein n=1 Tax=Cuscuta australis TaxID=267555 RepID=A0A328D9S0_9ASTE|nr:hypothetical protein DM860_008747 [Cuscuta australis]
MNARSAMYNRVENPNYLMAGPMFGGPLDPWNVGEKATVFLDSLLHLSKTRPRSRLEARDKCTLVALVSLLAVGNVARVMGDKTGLYVLGDTFWPSVSVFSNSACLCPLMLSPLSAMKNLLMARTHNKATAVLKKYMIFHHYFKVVLLYILIAPVLEYSLPNLLASYDYWIILGALELVKLVFYVYTGRLFTPKEDTPHTNIVISDEEEEAAARRFDDLERDFVTLYPKSLTK